MHNWSSQNNNSINSSDNNDSKNKQDDSTTKATKIITDTTTTSASDRNDTQSNPPPPKRRKIDRPPSPPWKSAAHEGPTSFLIDGRRISSRTNKLLFDPASPAKPVVTSITTPSTTAATTVHSPLDLQNPSKRRHLSARPNPASPSATKSKGPKSAAAATGSKHPIDSSSSSNAKNNSRSRSASARGAAASASTSNRSNQVTKARRSNASGIDPKQSHPHQDVADPTSIKKRPVPRIRLKVAKPSLGAFHPGNVLRPRKYSDFRDWFENEGAIDSTYHPLTAEEALREARIRRRLLEAGEPGNILSEDRCSLYLTDPIEEPPRQFFHRDHLIAHTLYFKKLLDKEHKQHRNVAKVLAQACAEEWRRRHKRPEELLRQQQDLLRQKRRQVNKDLQRLFDNVRAEVDRMRLEKWEAERKIQDQMALNKAIKHSTMLFEKRRPDRYNKKVQDGDIDRGTGNDEIEGGDTVSEGR
ncbi:swr1 complex component, partial [Ascosphaera aggregata]